jgi:hypothetical protein
MNDSPKVAGIIGYYGLSEWWFSTFSEEERNYINYQVRSMRAGPNALIEGTPWINPDTSRYGVSFFLNNLTFWFRHPKDNSVARRIALKAYELADDLDNISAALGWIIRLYYPVRETVPDAFDLVISSCQHHIGIAPLLADRHKINYPSLSLGKHEGYNRYVIILEKQGQYDEVIRLCAEAKQHGWLGDWDKRIERCTKRLSRITEKKS